MTRADATTAAPVRDQLQRALQEVRISLVDRCNFRCPYCMPEERYPRDSGFLPQSAWLSMDEIVRIASALHTLGVRKFRLTGGEPLLRKGVPDLVRQLKMLPDSEVVLTTNASLLAPQAAALKASGLDRLTISLDSLDPERFKRLSGGRGDIADVLAGVAAAEQAGFTRIKFNCVVQRDVNTQDVLPLLEFARQRGHVMRYIEYMDVGSCNRWRSEQVYSAAEILADIRQQHRCARLPGHPADTAQRYQVARSAADQPLDGGGEFGIVASVSQPFCRGCTRARIATDGQLLLCLFATRGHDLKPLLAADDATLTQAIAAIWRGRDDRYSELRAATRSAAPKLEMYQIGG
jgi:GTP 3',8-cyclase